MELLWNEIEQYRIAELIKKKYFTTSKSVSIKNGNERYTLMGKGHPLYGAIANHKMQYPVKKNKVSVDSFFKSLPTHMREISTKRKRGVSEISEVNVDQVAPSTYKIYDYDKDPYKDPLERSRCSVFSHIPMTPKEWKVTSDKKGIYIDNIYLVGNEVSISYSSDLITVIMVDFYKTPLLMIQTGDIQRLVNGS